MSLEYKTELSQWIKNDELIYNKIDHSYVIRFKDYREAKIFYEFLREHKFGDTDRVVRNLFTQFKKVFGEDPTK